MSRWLLPLGLLLAAAAGAGEVYRVVEPDGSVRYTDRPPHPHARPLQLGIASGTTPAGARKRFYSVEALRSAARFAVSIEAPTPGQVLRPGIDRAVAAASVMPGLVSGFGLMYFLDGRALTDRPVDALSLLLPVLAPGEYRISAAVYDAQGREVARSAETPFSVAPAPR